MKFPILVVVLAFAVVAADENRLAVAERPQIASVPQSAHTASTLIAPPSTATTYEPLCAENGSCCGDTSTATLSASVMSRRNK